MNLGAADPCPGILKSLSPWLFSKEMETHPDIGAMQILRGDEHVYDAPLMVNAAAVPCGGKSVHICTDDDSARCSPQLIS